MQLEMVEAAMAVALSSRAREAVLSGDQKVAVVLLMAVEDLYVLSIDEWVLVHGPDVVANGGPDANDLLDYLIAATRGREPSLLPVLAHVQGLVDSIGEDPGRLRDVLTFLVEQTELPAHLVAEVTAEVARLQGAVGDEPAPCPPRDLDHAVAAVRQALQGEDDAVVREVLKHLAEDAGVGVTMHGPDEIDTIRAAGRAAIDALRSGLSTEDGFTWMSTRDAGQAAVDGLVAELLLDCDRCS